MKPLAVLALCCLLHVILASIISSPWLVPDMTLAGLILVCGAFPDRWMIFATMAGMWAMIWAIRFPIPIFFSYFSSACLLRLIADRWDTADPRIQSVFACGVSFLSAAIWLWIEESTSWALLAWAVVRATVTGISLIGLHYLTRIRVNALTR
ncbi:MAG: hypothetical protein HYU33_03945 [Candidatus Omnitrophica bacterium]|nr:hypothetical protein [Candidatus Omnitrophota bacterium]MBI3009971.1 hypothetical protein [Candidatus Omnitrophota bacterium]